MPAEPDLESGFREIRDLYIEGTHLRLREVRAADGSPERFKLTQKLGTDSALATQITNLYVSEAEHALLAQLPGRTLLKRRYSFECASARFGIDRFLGQLEGLILAEVEGSSAAELAAIPSPPFAHCEVTDSPAFTGGELAYAEPADVLALMARLLG